MLWSLKERYVLICVLYHIGRCLFVTLQRLEEANRRLAEKQAILAEAKSRLKEVTFYILGLTRDLRVFIRSCTSCMYKFVSICLYLCVCHNNLFVCVLLLICVSVRVC